MAEALVEGIFKRAQYVVARVARETQVSALMRTGQSVPDFVVWKSLDEPSLGHRSYLLLAIEVKYCASLDDHLRRETPARSPEVALQWPELYEILVTDRPELGRSCFQAIHVSILPPAAPLEHPRSPPRAGAGHLPPHRRGVRGAGAGSVPPHRSEERRITEERGGLGAQARGPGAGAPRVARAPAVPAGRRSRLPARRARLSVVGRPRAAARRERVAQPGRLGHARRLPARQQRVVHAEVVVGWPPSPRSGR